MSNTNLNKTFTKINFDLLNEIRILITSENIESIDMAHRLRFLIEKQLKKELIFYFKFTSNLQYLNLFYFIFLYSYKNSNDARFISILIKFNKIFYLNYIMLSLLTPLNLNKSETNLFLHYYKKTNAYYNSFT